jgi:hypothetical protein
MSGSFSLSARRQRNCIGFISSPSQVVELQARERQGQLDPQVRPAQLDLMEAMARLVHLDRPEPQDLLVALDQPALQDQTVPMERQVPQDRPEAAQQDRLAREQLDLLALLARQVRLDQVAVEAVASRPARTSR